MLPHTNKECVEQRWCITECQTRDPLGVQNYEVSYKLHWYAAQDFQSVNFQWPREEVGWDWGGGNQLKWQGCQNGGQQRWCWYLKYQAIPNLVKNDYPIFQYEHHGRLFQTH